MIFVSLLGIGLFVLGLYTDVEFSNDMFNRSKPFNASEDFDDFQFQLSEIRQQ